VRDTYHYCLEVSGIDELYMGEIDTVGMSETQSPIRRCSADGPDDCQVAPSLSLTSLWGPTAHVLQ
jgi:hypothetical protein